MTADQFLMLVAGIVIGIDIAMAVHLLGRHLDARRDLREARREMEALEARTAALTETERP